jgi:hypothetical protein
MADEQTSLAPLTAEQVENWRRMLALSFGTYAFLMSVEQIEALRAGSQKRLDEMAERKQEVG